MVGRDIFEKRGLRLNYTYVLLFQTAKIIIKTLVLMPTGSRIDQLRALLEEEPGDPFLNYALGLEFLKMNDLQHSCEVFRGLSERSPDYLATYYQLGKVYEAMQEKEKALRTYEIGLAVAKAQGHHHTYTELRGAITALDEENDD